MNKQSKKLRETLFQKVFWRTIITLFIITVVLILLASLRNSDNDLKKAQNKRVLSEDSLKKISPFIAATYKNIGQNPYPKEFKDDLFKKVDIAFLPVYQNIPKFVDVHYSVIGSYTEIGLAATGNLASSIQAKLFHNFNEEKLFSDINKTIPNALLQMMEAFTRDEIERIKIPIEQQLAFKLAISQALKEHITTFRTGIILSGGVSGAIGGVASVKLMATIIARKLLVKLGAKLVAKLALKSGGTIGMAATGAVIGSTFPIVGSIIGGITGAVIGWVTVDSAFISVDEWLNRDEFETDLRIEVTRSKEAMKREIMFYANSLKNKLSSPRKETRTEKTPSDF